MGRVYLTAVSVSLLLLLTWHFSLQSAAHDLTREQVRTWLHNLGAEAGDIQFRMLRGALVVNDIQASVKGNPLHIQQLLLKGNPATITSDKPLLNQVTIVNASFDAYAMSQTWPEPDIDLPDSLANILYQAKNISLQGSSIKHAYLLPEIFIGLVQIKGAGDKRQLQGRGFIDSSANHWTVESLMPTDHSRQSGRISYQFQGLNNQTSWSGSWKSENLRLTSLLSHLEGTLKVQTEQQQQQWLSSFDAYAWPLHLNGMQSSVTGSGSFSGTPENWIFDSDKLIWDDFHLDTGELGISRMSTHKLNINSASKRIAVDQLQLHQPSFTLDIDQESLPKPAWDTYIKAMDITALQSKLRYQNKQLILPVLSGSATVQSTSIRFDISTPAAEEQFVRLKSGPEGSVLVSARNIPLVQLRSLLPDPIQQQATSLLGNTSLKLTLKPLQQWHTSGNILVTDAQLASEHQLFKADLIQLHIQHADTSGVHQASFEADDWLMQFPLTPKQAWSDESYLDAWAAIPWSLQTMTFSDGKVSIGNEDQVWISDANLQLTQWQSPQPGTLELKGEFGLSPIRLRMALQSNPQHVMQWQSFNLNTKHADLFALSEWLKLSELPQIERGHFSVNLNAERIDVYTRASADITLNHMLLTPIQTMQQDDDLPLQETSFFSPHLANQLNSRKSVQLNFPIQGRGDWSRLGAEALLKALQSQLARTPSREAQPKWQSSLLGSLHIHQNNGFSQNERVRLRQMIKQTKNKKNWHLELTPDLGTNELSPVLRQQIYHTQALIKNFISQRGISSKDIYIIRAREKHQSTSSSAAIHVKLVSGAPLL